MKHFLTALFFLSLISCSKEIVNPKDYSYAIPQSLNDHISVKKIEEYRIDTSLIFKLNRDIIDENIYNVHSVLIYKDDALFYEKYLCGKDEKHGKNLGIIQHDIRKIHDVRSISKTVVSACIGIAIQKGLINSVNEPIKTFLPELCKHNDSKSKITIKNLLTMSSGLHWEEIGNYSSLLNDETKMDLSFNPVEFVLDKKMVSEAGTNWNYSGGNTQVLAEIIKRVSGKNILEFAKENLFEPLGITEYEWICLTTKELPAAASGLRLTSRGLLKMGILYNDNGRFNNTQVIDSHWAASSIATHINRPSLKELNLEDGGYGFQFWTYDFVIKNKSIKVTEAKGNGGQSIFICKELGLVVVLTAGNYGKVEHNATPYKILKDYILPAVMQE